MMRLPVPLVSVVLLSVLAACDAEPRVVVRATLDGRPVADLPVTLLPYDRQAILDSLAEDRESPEPVIPQDAVQQLRSLRAGGGGVKAPAPGDSASAAAPAPAEALRARLDSLLKARRAWYDSITPAYEEAVKERVSNAGQSERADTTGADGRAELPAAAGQWWLFARYVLPDEELEWYLPVTVRGDSLVVELDRGNAKSSPALF